MVLQNVGEHFQEELGPEGPWPDLQPETWERKAFTYGSGTILWESGDLYRSIDEEWGSDYAEVYSAGVEYAAAHEKGVKKRNLPARSFIWIDDRTWDWILDKAGDVSWKKMGPEGVVWESGTKHVR